EDSVDDVAFDQEALVPGRFFTKVASKEVSEGDTARLAVVDEETSMSLGFKPLLRGDGVFFRVLEDALLGVARLSDTDGEAVVESGQCWTMALGLQRFDVLLHRLGTAVGEGLGELGPLGDGDFEPRTVLDGSHDIAP